MHQSVHYLYICFIMLMLRRLPSTLGFLAGRTLPASRHTQLRALGSIDSAVASDADKVRALVSKLNLSLSKRGRLTSRKDAKPLPVVGTVQVDAIKSNKDKIAGVNGFASLGLCEEIVTGLHSQGINVPTPVQGKVISRILSGENLVMAASTGSGKTLAYTLPCIQGLHMQEQEGYVRRPKRPRVLVLVPTRELARQVLDSVKMIGHHAKVSSTAVLGGEQYGMQKIQLDRLVDVVVASPGRLMQHKLQGNVYFSQVRHVIIDEVDTMLTQGFGPDIRAILRSVVANRMLHATDGADGVEGGSAAAAGSLEAEEDGSDLLDPSQMLDTAGAFKPAPLRKQPREEVKPAQVVMATATLTRAVKALLDDVKGGFNIEFADPSNATPRVAKADDQRIKINVVEVDGVHRSLPNVEHVFEEAARDKMVTLRDVLARHRAKQMRTLIFCNTVQSCRAVEYAINQDITAGGSFSGEDVEIHATSYHGDLNSIERAKNLENFRSGEEQYMVCSDMAARGLDIPETGHVVMFDFPLNPVDYLHRAGRCGRAGRIGLVTALVAKRDLVLAQAIETAISKGLPIDSLSSDKKDYTGTGRLSRALSTPRKAESTDERDRRQHRLQYNITRSKATKVKGEAATRAANRAAADAAAPSSSGSSSSVSGGRENKEKSRTGRGGSPAKSGGRSGARLRAAVAVKTERVGRALSSHTARSIARSSLKGTRFEIQDPAPSPGDDFKKPAKSKGKSSWSSDRKSSGSGGRGAFKGRSGGSSAGGRGRSSSPKRK